MRKIEYIVIYSVLAILVLYLVFSFIHDIRITNCIITYDSLIRFIGAIIVESILLLFTVVYGLLIIHSASSHIHWPPINSIFDMLRILSGDKLFSGKNHYSVLEKVRRPCSNYLTGIEAIKRGYIFLILGLAIFIYEIININWLVSVLCR